MLRSVMRVLRRVAGCCGGLQGVAECYEEVTVCYEEVAECY